MEARKLSPLSAQAVEVDRRALVGTPPVVVAGVPVHPLTAAAVVAHIQEMIAAGGPHQIVTANLDFLTQARYDVELRRIFLDADLVLGDGMPVVWASRWLGQALPERVAGADLLAPILEMAERRRYRVFFLGGTPAVAERAMANIRARYPGLPVAHVAPPYRELLAMDHDQINRRIRAMQPHLLFVAFGCPKAEKWIAMQNRELGVPVAMGIGGTLDFVAGKQRRAPQWMQQTGAEWLYRLAQEPRRLWHRYAMDLLTLGRLLPQCLLLRGANDPLPAPQDGVLDTANLRRVNSALIAQLLPHRRHLVLVDPSRALRRALVWLRLTDEFMIAPDESAARRLLFERAAEPNAFETGAGVLQWRGEVTTQTAPLFWDLTQRFVNDWGVAQRTLVVDLTPVRHLDSAGIELMRRARDFARQRRVNLEFRHPSAAVGQVIAMAGGIP